MKNQPVWLKPFYFLVFIFLSNGVAFAAPLTILAVVAPTVTVSGLGAVSLWEDAGGIGGAAVDVHAIAAFVGATDPTFDTRNGDDPSFFLTSQGSATLRWEIFEAGTNQSVTASGGLIYQITDIDGTGGAIDTREAVNAVLDRLTS